MAPLAKALAVRGFTPSLILTGQHPGLDLAECGLHRLPAVLLDCVGQPAPHKHVEQVFEALFPYLERTPDLVIVQGDTSSALGGSLAAVAARVPLAHVEAGLRSHDVRQPWPEEEYRRRIDAEADLLFAPTETAAQNLRREHVRGAIHVTGNTGIDALLEVRKLLPRKTRSAPEEVRLLVTCHRRENWGAGLTTLADALRTLAQEDRVRIELVLHPNPEVAFRFERLLGDRDNIILSLPCSHLELVRKMRDCSILLSDSGGMQEEAPALGTPLLILREKTERPEGVATGNARLVRLNATMIVAAVRELLANPILLAKMSLPTFPYGAGDAAPKIASIIEQWLALRSGSQLRRA